MIAAAGNNAISDSDPNKYLPELSAKLGEDADGVFSSNLLPKPSAFYYSKATYEGFLKARAQLVSDFVGELCGGNLP